MNRGVTIRLSADGVRVETPVADTVTYEVVSVNPFDRRLDYWASNPAVRRKRSMSELRDSIRSVGRILVPVAIVETERGRWNLPDGNRRLLVARELGLKAMPALLIRGVKPAYWAAIAATTGRPWKLVEGAMLAESNPSALRFISKSMRRKISGMKEVLGADMNRFLHENQTSAANIVYWVGRACREYDQGSVGFRRRAVLWAERQIKAGDLNFGQFQLAARVGKGALKDFVPAVVQDRPMRFMAFAPGQGS